MPDGREFVRTTDDLVAMVFSSSPSTPAQFGERVGDFERDLRGMQVSASPEGRFSVRLADNVLRIWRQRATVNPGAVVLGLAF